MGENYVINTNRKMKLPKKDMPVLVFGAENDEVTTATHNGEEWQLLYTGLWACDADIEFEIVKWCQLDILSPEWWQHETGGTGETQIIELDE